MKKYMNKLCSLRAGAASIGHAVAVAPIFGLRVSIAIGLEGFGVNLGVWGKIALLPFEVAVPFLYGLYLLAKNPVAKPLGYTARTVFTSLVLSPFITVLFLFMFYWVARGAGGDQSPVMMIMGLVPSLGTLGLIGFVFLFFPWILFGWLLALGLDSLIFFLNSAGLEDLRTQQMLETHQKTAEASWLTKLRLSIPGFRKKTLVSGEYHILKIKEEISENHRYLIADLDAVKEGVQKRGPGLSTGNLRRVRDEVLNQLVAVEEKYLAFHNVLVEKMKSHEITFVRYHGSARQVYLSVVDHIGEIVTSLKTGLMVESQDHEEQERVRGLLTQNDEALKTMDDAIVALGAIKTKSQAEIDQPLAIRDLEELAARAGRYSR